MHKSVLLEEAIQYLNLKEDSIVVDCTLGYGGHSSHILQFINKGHLYAFDQDLEAIQYSQKRLSQVASNYTIINNNFCNLKDELNKRDVYKVDGILFDLGVSSPQLDESKRGFSFHQDARLDMRMNQNNPLSAYEVVNNYSYIDLVNILTKYGEEKYASNIASGIVKARPIETTLQLVEVIKNSVPQKYSREKHPARKTFQAIRIEVNDELNVFEKSLRQALELLQVNGRICVITFHSLEDRLCKKIFKEVSSVNKDFNNLPIVPEHLLPKFKLIANLEPTKNEIDENLRARSARLRVIERVRN